MPTEPATPGTDAIHKPGEKWTSPEHAYRDGFQHGFFAALQKYPNHEQHNQNWKQHYANWMQPDAVWTSADHAFQNGYQNGHQAAEQHQNYANQYPQNGFNYPQSGGAYPQHLRNGRNDRYGGMISPYAGNQSYSPTYWSLYDDPDYANQKPGYTKKNYDEYFQNPGRMNNGYNRERNHMEGINSDKVNIHLGGGGGDGGYGGGNAGLAAVIAALGNRNQGGDMAALIAALGHRDDRRCDDGGFGFGGGGGILGLVALLGLLRGGIGGHGGKDCDDNHGGLFNATVLSKLGSIEGGLPAVTAAVGDAIAQLALGTQAGFAANQSAVASLALGVQQGLANNKDSFQAGLLASLAAIAGVKDSVQNGFALTTNNILEGVCSVKEVVRDDGDKTRALIGSIQDANLQRELTIAQNALSEERHARRVRDVEVTVTQTNQQAQLQAQQQQQQQTLFDHLFKRLANIEIEQNQIAKNTNANLIIGSQGVATGAQSANPVNVR